MDYKPVMRPAWQIYAAAVFVWMGLAVIMFFALFGCSADLSSSSRDIVTHCTSHTIGTGAAGTTTVEDCDISIDSKSKSKSSGF